jgi:hypothetical protein
MANAESREMWPGTKLNRSGGTDLTKTAEKLASEIHALTDVDKLHLLDVILADLDKPDPEMDRVWADEARKRWSAYKAGRIPSVSYQDVMGKHGRS